MERENAPEEFKWKLSDIFKSHDDWEAAFNKLNLSMEKYKTFKGKLHDKNCYYEYLKFDEDFSKDYMLVYGYWFLNSDIDKNNNQLIEDEQKLDALGANLSEITAYIDPELSSLPKEYFDDVLKDEKFKDFDQSIDEFLRTKKFILSEKEEQALSTISKFSDGFSSIYDSLTQSDLDLGYINKDSKKIKLTRSNYIEFLKDKNPEIRKQAYDNMYNCYKQFSKTLSLNYISFVKMHCSDLKLRNQKSYLQSILYGNKIPESIYSNLIEEVNKNTNLEQKYFKLLKKQQNLQDFGFKDIHLSLATNIQKTYKIKEQQQIVFDALSPLGVEYQELLRHAYGNNWFDFCKGKDKKSGGYMADIYGVHPFVFLNDNENYDSLTTLAHEFGHAAHAYYSDKNQPYPKHDHSIFIAEIASTVNEILLNKYMQKNAKTPEEKLFYIDNYIQSFKGTVFRQTMFSEFEDFAFKKIENDEILSPKILQDKYAELIKKHFGDAVPCDDKIIYEYMRISHFYSPYYVYKYATSFLSSCYIANKILEGDKNMLANYKKMLSSGCDGYPTEILGITGIDLTKKDIFEYSFNDLKKSLDEAQNLINLTKNQQKTR